MNEKILSETLNWMKKGYTCSESVILAFSGIAKIPEELTPKIATGFSAGIGRIGEICGAISAGVIIIGAIYGRVSLEDINGYEKCIGKVQKLIYKFQEKYGEIHCEKLIGLKLIKEEDRERFRIENLKEKKCMRFIEDIVRILMEIIRENS
ncbi:MAG: C-GCAxxG-C-C family protein [Candidatus Methanomethylicia archaeon]|nr:C-GCAxxG-C-C family protein [Candidatus Methanomethylicia archaeon]